ncbi:MAG: hypothetical protein KDA54_05815 [Phycisphaerales bacterium]|nr:hypothetical protein [Phycisphaerales bacterium]
MLAIAMGAALFARCQVALAQSDDASTAASESVAVDTSRLSAEEQAQVYRKTLALKSKEANAEQFGFVEGVPVIGNIKSASSYDQCCASAFMHAYRRNTSEVAMTYMRELIEIRRANPGKYRDVSQELFYSKLGQILGISEPGQTEDVTSNSMRPRINEDSWKAILMIVPNTVQLGREAGYDDVRLQASLGLAMSLSCANIRREGTLNDFGKEILGRRMLKYTLQEKLNCEWERIIATIGRDIPMVVETRSGHAYIIVGFYAPSTEKKYLLGYSPVESERTVFYGGREFVESRLVSFKKENPPQPHWPWEVYHEFNSSHKKYQYPGFCILRFDDEMRFTFVEDVVIDKARIREVCVQALEAALTELP